MDVRLQQGNVLAEENELLDALGEVGDLSDVVGFGVADELGRDVLAVGEGREG